MCLDPALQDRVRRLLGDVPADAGEIRDDVQAYALLRGVGNLCIGAGTDPRYDARQLVALVLAGLRPSNGDRPGG